MVFSVANAIFLAAIVLSCFKLQEQRAFWLGFAIFGWGYWCVLHSPFLDFSKANNWRLNANTPLITTFGLTWLYNNVLPAVHTEPMLNAAGMTVNSSRFPNEVDFMRIGHSLAALLSATLGGGLGRYTYKMNRPAAGDNAG